jgi:hypothetical protein
LAPTDIAGASPWQTANWNNTQFRNDEFDGLVRDTNGIAANTNAFVIWTCNGTFSSTGNGEENNNFNGTDNTLMSGYLDTGDSTTSFAVIEGVPDDMAASYSVVIYGLGGRSNRGGEYKVNRVGPKFFVPGGADDGGTFTGPSYLQAVGDDPAYGSNDYGNYLVFSGLSGNTVVITAKAVFAGPVGNPRAPINAIQIVATPQD